MEFGRERPSEIAKMNPKQDKEELARKHKAERKELRKTCNDALAGKKGEERDAVMKNNEALTAEIVARHEQEMAALEASMEGVEIDEGKLKKEKAQQKRDKKKLKQKDAAAKIAEAKASSGPSLRNLEMDKLKKKLEPQGLEVKEMEADGHCLYRAVADQLCQAGNSSFDQSNSKTHHLLLRSMCAQYMQAHKDMFEPFIETDNGDTFQKYLEKLKNTSEWGGQLELRALAGALQTPIEVISADGDPILMGEEQSGSPLKVTYHKHYLSLGEHYNSVQPKP